MGEITAFFVLLLIIGGCASMPVVENQFTTDYVASQFLEISNPAEGIILEAEMGTKLFIPADTFKTDNPVILEVKEVYSKEDMLFSNISTETAYGILQSGGMLYLKAKDSITGKILRPRNSVDIAMPREYLNIDGRLYFGGEDNGIISWEPPDDYEAYRDMVELDILKEGERPDDDLLPSINGYAEYFDFEDDEMDYSEDADASEGVDLAMNPFMSWEIDEMSAAFYELSKDVYNKFTVWRFGWINVDKLLIPENPVDFSVKVPNSPLAIIYVIIHDTNSVLSREARRGDESTSAEIALTSLQGIEKGLSMTIFAVGRDPDGSVLYSNEMSIIAGETDEYSLYLNEITIPDLQILER